MAATMMNGTKMDLPSLPSYTLTPQPPLIAFIPDKYLSLALPIIAYWGLSMIFHYIDEFDLFPHYRLHTPAEVLKRNHVTRWQVVRDVVIQQIVQTIVGIGLALAEPDYFVGKEDFDVAVWAQRLRLAQRYIPAALAVTGIDAKSLAYKASSYSPSLAGALAGGNYASLISEVNGASVPAFASWEILVAKTIYYVAMPALQFFLAILIVDTWQYFLHRAMHMNKWLYSKLQFCWLSQDRTNILIATFHSRHHRLYVPYAYGALYNHPFEGFLLDTCGAGLAYLVTGLTPRQAICFFTGSTIKTVDDHSGYALPWDPLQRLTSNNAGYHDVHHQSWGIKTNFSQPFFTFWDRLLGTQWAGGDVSARYERARLAAERKMQQSNVNSTYTSSITGEMNSSRESKAPYEHDIPTASDLAQTAQTTVHSIPEGKAAAQAAGSREMVLADPDGGMDVLAEEAAEERKEVFKMPEPQPLRRSPRKKTISSTPAAQAGSILRERVGTTASCPAGSKGAMLSAR